MVQRHANPRSAIVIGVSAVEVGAKECIATLDPLAKWLVREVPTPPVERMFREYVPTLPATNRLMSEVRFPVRLLEDLKKVVGWRNQVAHGGCSPCRGTELKPSSSGLHVICSGSSRTTRGRIGHPPHVSQRTMAEFGIPTKWHGLGNVTKWDDDHAWGVVKSDDIPGEIWVEASMVETDDDRALSVGSRVVIEAEGPLERDHHGCRYRGIRVIHDAW